ncbi:hypothetical protein GCM10023096_18680 [Nonomuraea ferruginea]
MGRAITHVIHIISVPYELAVDFDGYDIEPNRVLVKEEIREFHLAYKLIAEN